MSKDTFFFEEDTAGGTSTGVTGEEQASAFMSVLEEGGMIKDRQQLTSFDPLKTLSDADTKISKTTLVEIEYGIVKGDYVVHVTPIHAQKNLEKKQLFDIAIRQTIVTLNKVVPSTLRVDIFLPRSDYKIKATSYVIREAADAWNFDAKKVEEVIPSILEQVGKICMMS